MVGPSNRNVVAPSARAGCPLVAALASFAFTFLVVGRAASPCAVELQGGLSSDPEGFSQSTLVRPTGTVSLSRDNGGCLKVTRRFDAIGIGDLERVGCVEELG